MSGGGLLMILFKLKHLYTFLHRNWHIISASIWKGKNTSMETGSLSRLLFTSCYCTGMVWYNNIRWEELLPWYWCTNTRLDWYILGDVLTIPKNSKPYQRFLWSSNSLLGCYKECLHAKFIKVEGLLMFKDCQLTTSLQRKYDLFMWCTFAKLG